MCCMHNIEFCKFKSLNMSDIIINHFISTTKQAVCVFLLPKQSIVARNVGQGGSLGGMEEDGME